MRLGLPETEWAQSAAVREWVLSHCAERYVPEELLLRLGIMLSDADGVAWDGIGEPPLTIALRGHFVAVIGRRYSVIAV